MLTKFMVENFKNFSNQIVVDFTNTAGYQFNSDCLIGNNIGKMIIYGCNATGKTNLGSAIIDIRKNIVSSSIRTNTNDDYLNANSASNFAKFAYEFSLDNVNIQYQYTKDRFGQLVTEDLVVDSILYFRLDFKNNYIEFPYLAELESEGDLLEQYKLFIVQTTDTELEDRKYSPSAMRWLISNVPLPKNSILPKLIEFILRITAVSVLSSTMLKRNTVLQAFIEELAEPEKLEDFSDFLNGMGVDCNLVVRTLPDETSALYFDNKKLLPFNATASSGTLALTDIYRRLGDDKKTSLLYIDEFDAFYHYEMAYKMIRYLKEKYPDTQVILSTHNTTLMTNQLMRPDCLFILSRSGMLTPLSKATRRELREGHNLQKMYISGEFDEYE